MPHPHDQLGATRLVAVEVHGDQAIDHVALALPHARHIDRGGIRHDPELCRVVYQVGDFRAPDLVLAGEAVDIRAGAADPAAFHHGRPAPGVRHVPGQILAALATAKDEDIKPFRLGHAYLLVRASELPSDIRAGRPGVTTRSMALPTSSAPRSTR